MTELIQMEQRRLYILALHLTGSHHDAEDVSQEAFVHALTHLNNLREPRAFSRWLSRIVTNIAYELHRRRRHTVPMKDETVSSMTEYNKERVTPGDEETTGKELRRILLAETLESLPMPQRTALVLRELYEYSYEELAKVLEVPVGTVRSRLAAAREKLKAVFEEGGKKK